MLGDSEVVTDHFRKICNTLAKARESIALLEDSQCELVLQRRCFDVSKVTYILRCIGDQVDEAALHSYDDALRDGTEDALRGAIGDESWIQATLGVDAAGLEMKEASVIALPAFIASRVASRHFVEEMCRHAETVGIATVSQCMEAYECRTRSACKRCSTTLP